MAKSKWETHVKDKLILVEAWARDGLTDEQIANNLGISIQTFYTYKTQYLEFFESLKKGKEVVDIEVENALLKRALGFEQKEITKETRLNPITKEYEVVATKEVIKPVPPDTTAQIFWLKNRRPDKWRDKNVIEHEGEIKNTFDLMTDEELEKEIRKLEEKLGIDSE